MGRGERKRKERLTGLNGYKGKREEGGEGYKGPLWVLRLPSDFQQGTSVQGEGLKFAVENLVFKAKLLARFKTCNCVPTLQ